MTIVSQHFDYVIGVDTHSRTHTLVIKNAAGIHLHDATFPTSRPGLTRAHTWIRRNTNGDVLIAMEGTGTYGAVFADLLNREGFIVAETKPPRRQSRRAGKSDTIDADAAATHALAQPVDQLISPRRHDGDRAALSVLLTGRRAKTTERSATGNALIALLRTHDLGIDARIAPGTATIRAIASWRARATDTAWIATIRAEAANMAKAILRKDAELLLNEKGLIKHVTSIAPWLLELPGTGPVAAAQLIVSFSHTGRIRSEAAFARLAGAAPIPASSGVTTRHRLHRGGDRQLNRALWIIATNRLLRDPETRAYYERRSAQGKNRKEIIRSLKRYIARSLFRQMSAQMP